MTDKESGKTTVKSKIWIGGLKKSYTYTGSVIKPTFHVYDGTRKLTEKTDYKVSWVNNKDVGTATIKLKFKGNYSDTKEETAEFTIAPAVLGADIIAHETGAEVKKNAQKPVPVLTWAKTGKKIGIKDFDIVYSPSTVKDEGDYVATVRPKKQDGNFAGSTTALIRVTGSDKLLSKAKVVFDKKSYAYTGKPVVPGYVLKTGTTELKEGTDYKLVSIAGNTDPGTATVIFEAVSGNAAGYAGCKTAAFKISGKIELKDTAPFEYSYKDSIPFAKGGAQPAVTVKHDGATLKEGIDYTLKYAKNRAVTSGATAEIKIKGKGSYKGTVIKNFAVTKQSLSALSGNITVTDQFKAKSKLGKPSVTIMDTDGKRLKAGTDYTIGDMDTTDPANTEESGMVYIILTGKGSYSEGAPVKASFRYMQTVSSDIAKTKAFAIKDQTYTGGEVRLGRDDLKEVLYTGSKSAPSYLVYGTDFVVEGYSDNVKTGKAKVTVRGIGAFAGRKILTFKIVQKKVDYAGVPGAQQQR